jgi:hypothetical protein
VYVSALNVGPLDTGVVPDRFVGEPPAPVAVNVHAVGTADPPLLLVTVFTSVNDGATSSFVTVHVFVTPFAIEPVQSAEKLAA